MGKNFIMNKQFSKSNDCLNYNICRQLKPIITFKENQQF